MKLEKKQEERGRNTKSKEEKTKTGGKWMILKETGRN